MNTPYSWVLKVATNGNVGNIFSFIEEIQKDAQKELEKELEECQVLASDLADELAKYEDCHYWTKSSKELLDKHKKYCWGDKK